MYDMMYYPPLDPVCNQKEHSFLVSEMYNSMDLMGWVYKDFLEQRLETQDGCYFCKDEKKLLKYECKACTQQLTTEFYCSLNPRHCVSLDEDPIRVCCRAYNAKCNSCAAGLSEGEYCAKNPKIYGCEELTPPPEEPRMCCMAMTAGCLACAANVSVEDYCVKYPFEIGCPDVPRACCEAMTAECLACAKGVSVWEYCARMPDSFDCPTFLESEAKMEEKESSLPTRPTLGVTWKPEFQPGEDKEFVEVKLEDSTHLVPKGMENELLDSSVAEKKEEAVMARTAQP